MMNKLILGRYFPGQSWIHRLDPRGKLLAALMFIIIVFLANNWITYSLLWMFTLSAMVFSRVPLKIFIRGVRPLIYIILFTVTLQILFRSGGTIYFDWGAITISSAGLLNGLYIFFRFMMIIFVTTVLTLTTKPIDLTDAINYFLKPLAKLGIPVSDVGLMMTISMRFIPNLLDETQKVMDAQRARGVSFGEGNLIQQMKLLMPIFLPLYTGSLVRAEELANAMEVRGYISGNPRTSFRILNWKLKDLVLLLIYAVLIYLLLLLRN